MTSGLSGHILPVVMFSCFVVLYDTVIEGLLALAGFCLKESSAAENLSEKSMRRSVFNFTHLVCIKFKRRCHKLHGKEKGVEKYSQV